MEHCGSTLVGAGAWGWRALLDAYYFLFMFCVLVTFFFFNYPCNKMSSKNNLKREDFILACGLGM